jgi:hypothetical protein
MSAGMRGLTCLRLRLLSASQRRNCCVQDCHELSVVLKPAFSSATIQKLGLELTSDLSKLASSYTHIAAFRHVCHCLDLKQLWGLFQSAGGPLGAGAAKRSAVGLSFLAQELLGKPLDKAMQVLLLLQCAPLCAR